MRTLIARYRRRRRRRPTRPSPQAGPPEVPDHESLVRSLTPSEWAAVLDLLHDEIAQGWVPQHADVVAALDVLQIARSPRRTSDGAADR
ncbi:hypothetical protein [Nocardioides sp. 1609]|uniref:hypothetical protein n=1 Tax=Nocardioides sp. 1609 TaxID=2508327 RepID=UPI00106FF7D0|nr:hypothetical protein [Nocardioides sp. 1609]